MNEPPSRPPDSILSRKSSLLRNWCAWAESVIRETPDRKGAYFGSGFDVWGVQTNQKALAAMAAGAEDAGDGARGHRQDLALRMLRFSMGTHQTGADRLMDGGKWGHTWISVLGLERMLHVLPSLVSLMSESDQRALRRLLLSEADWLTDHCPVEAGKVTSNKPESNLWNGSLLYRVAMMAPDAERTEAYVEKATRFLLNGISVDADARGSERFLDRPLRDWHVDSQFFDSMALNHHEYLNVGYMVICLSQVALLHFACRQNGWPAPAALYHHAEDLWHLVRIMTFPDGRLARIGGDTRTRYTYCQDYLPLVWRLAEDLEWTGLDPEQDRAWLGTMEKEATANGDGSFFGQRLSKLKEGSWNYYSRLESDRASVLSTEIIWADLFPGSLPSPLAASGPVAWQDDFHGAAMIRDDKHLVSWTWQAALPPQGLCLPIDRSDLGEWHQNLGGEIIGRGLRNRQVVESHDMEVFKGGFVTWGITTHISENLPGEGNPNPLHMARQFTVAAALPDGKTLIVYQSCRSCIRDRVRSIKGLLLNVPNDLFNQGTRTYTTSIDRTVLRGADGGSEQVRPLGGSWVNIDDVISVIPARGSDALCLFQPGVRNIGIKSYPHASTEGLGGSLWADQICLPFRENIDIEPGEILYENTFAVVSGINAAGTAERAASMISLQTKPGGLTEVICRTEQGAVCVLLINGKEEPLPYPPDHKTGITRSPTTQDASGRRIFPGHSAALIVT